MKDFFSTKKLLLTALVMSLIFKITIAQTITIGTGTSTGQHLPIEPYYGYTYSQTIYYQSQINFAGTITKIAYYYAGSAWTDNINVYMALTTNTNFSSTTSWYPYSLLTQVFSGNITAPSTPAWIEITLQVPFYYNNVANLLIAVDENTTGYHLSTDEFYCTSVSENRSIYYYSDNTNPSPSVPPTGTLNTYIPNTKLFFVAPYDAATVQMNSPVSALTLSSNEIVSVMIKNYGTNAISNFPVSYKINGGTPVTETITQTMNSGDSLIYSFSTTANLSADGTYIIKAYTSLANDAYHQNDTVTTSILNYEMTYNMIAGVNSITTCGAIIYDNGGPNGNYTDYFDGTLTIYPGYPNARVSITFESFFSEANYDYLFVYNGNSTSSPVLLSSYSGSGIPGTFTSTSADGSLTFRFYTDISVTYAGFKINTSCIMPCDYDAGIFQIINPVSNYNLASNEAVTIKVKNLGLYTFSNFPVSFSVDGSSPVTETITTSILAGNTYNYTFNATANLSAPGTHTIVCFTGLQNDCLHANDTTTKIVHHVEPGDSCTTALNYGLINSPAVSGSIIESYDAQWYYFTLDTIYANVVVTLCGSTFDTYLQVYNACSGTLLASNDDYCGLQSQVSFSLLQPGTYYVKVYGYSSFFGNFILNIYGTSAVGNILGCMDPNASNYNPNANLSDGSCVYYPDGTICEDPINIQLPVIDLPGSTVGFPDMYYDLVCGGNYMNGSDVVYRFTVNNNGYLTGSIVGNWAGMVILNSCPLSEATCFASASGYNGGSFSNAYITQGTYYVLVSSYPPPQTMNFILNLSFVISGCTDPNAVNYNPLAVISDGNCVYTGTLCSNPNIYGLINSPAVSGSISASDTVWYKFTLDDTYEDVIVSLCNSEFDTYLEVWENCNNSDIIGTNNDMCGNKSLVTFSELSQGEYYVLVSGINNSQGNYNLQITGNQIQPVIFGCTDTAALNYNPSATADDGSCSYYIAPNPGWFYSNTGMNHTILIPTTATIEVNTIPISVGDYIGVFYDSLGTLACGGYVRWNDETTTIAAWSSNGSVNGFAVNEYFKWKIWQLSSGITYDALASYMSSPNPMPNNAYFQNFGLSGLTALYCSTVQSQDILIPQGWSMISTYIEPSSTLINDVFASIAFEIVIVKNNSGQVFWPTYNINQIGNIVLGEAYRFKMLSQQIITISGFPAVPENSPIPLNQGWNLIGYLRQSQMLVDVAFSSIVAHLDIVKDDQGFVYWPAFNLNNIGNLKPGEGYQIRVQTALIYLYPPN